MRYLNLTTQLRGFATKIVLKRRITMSKLGEINFVGKILSYMKLEDCSETGDQRIKIEVEIVPGFVVSDRRREFVLYVGAMKHPSYSFTVYRNERGDSITAQWYEEPETLKNPALAIFGPDHHLAKEMKREIELPRIPDVVFLSGSQEAHDKFSKSIWPE